MGITQKDIKLLWGRAASRCAICRNELSENKTAIAGQFPIGEQAHIVAEQENGPRGQSVLTSDERNSYHNLILLCPTHHKVIDKNTEDYPVERLHILKSQHELWVQKSLQQDVVSEDLNPVSELIYALDDILPVIHWYNRPVPPEKAEAFFHYLSQIWAGSLLVIDVPNHLKYGLNYALRPGASGDLHRKNEEHYIKSKLFNAGHHFSLHFDWPSFELRGNERHATPKELLSLLSLEARRSLEKKTHLNFFESNALQLLLFIVGYYQDALSHRKYITISESFVRQAHFMIEEYLKTKLGYSLPSPIDRDENELLHQMYTTYKVGYLDS